MSSFRLLGLSFILSGSGAGGGGNDSVVTGTSFMATGLDKLLSYREAMTGCPC